MNSGEKLHIYSDRNAELHLVTNPEDPHRSKVAKMDTSLPDYGKHWAERIFSACNNETLHAPKETLKFLKDLQEMFENEKRPEMAEQVRRCLATIKETPWQATDEWKICSKCGMHTVAPYQSYKNSLETT